MSVYTEFFLNSKSNVIQYQLLEISHPSFSKIHYIDRNATKGLTVKLEDCLYHDFIYYPLQITLGNEKNDLDQSIKIQFGDLGEILPSEIDLVEAADTFQTKPILKYRTFRSDDLLNVLYGPIDLEIKTVSFNSQGALIEAVAPRLNVNTTGEIYSIARFPTLRGLL